MSRSLSLPVLLCLLWVTSINAADWPTFRGPHRDGQTTDTNIPLEVSIGGADILVCPERTFRAPFSRTSPHDLRQALPLREIVPSTPPSTDL